MTKTSIFQNHQKMQITLFYSNAQITNSSSQWQLFFWIFSSAASNVGWGLIFFFFFFFGLQLLVTLMFEEILRQWASGVSSTYGFLKRKPPELCLLMMRPHHHKVITVCKRERRSFHPLSPDLCPLHGNPRSLCELDKVFGDDFVFAQSPDAALHHPQDLLYPAVQR